MRYDRPMRAIPAVILVAACGGGFQPPDDCAAGHLHYLHTLDAAGAGEGDVAIASHAFQNAFGGAQGRLDIGVVGTERVIIEFRSLIADGGSDDARGSVSLAAEGIDVGNCADAKLTGTIYVDGGSKWRFSLNTLNMGPDYCHGADLTGEIAGCFQGN